MTYANQRFLQLIILIVGFEYKTNRDLSPPKPMGMPIIAPVFNPFKVNIGALTFKIIL